MFFFIVLIVLLCLGACSSFGEFAGAMLGLLILVAFICAVTGG